eukprot:gnl/TRDRNA2_/TRDRNA2_81004_c0_seq1.p1 gnl/TRDRNA2_/TRDRNA2_81004_c0~~gnl/TRDRNA2_/TRDRNA2_81004_c0_seq1.p1  ORF type:complete len:592 (+),score=147.52 gnl/TRDRNA2_/TRDRNA2_81004_c0_seq1:67-1842(+)
MPDEEKAKEDGEEEEVGEEEEAKVPLHTEPFELKVLCMVNTQRSQNGLRHNDHLRYRQYCARRLRRLRCTLRWKHGRGRFKQALFPADFADKRYLEIPLVNAERAWSYGVQLKADNATASALNPQWRQHSVRRFAKASKWAEKLIEVCKVHGDQRTQLEAEAYEANVSGVLHLEKEEFQEALTKFQRCRKLCEHLSLASEQEESALFKAKVQELAPSIRECKYNLGLGFDDEEVEEGAPKAKGEAGGKKKGKKEAAEFSYRGQALITPPDKIKMKLVKCLGLVNDCKAEGKPEQAQDNNAVIEKYSELSNEFGDVLKDIHSEMISAGADTQTSEWRMLEAFAREFCVVMNVERNLVLLQNHLAKLDTLHEISSSDARKLCRPEEGMRYCDMLKEDMKDLLELPESDANISNMLGHYMKVVLNCRCFFLGLCHASMGKTLESAALLDLLNSRIDKDSEGLNAGKKLQEPLGRLHRLFYLINKDMPSKVGAWRCRGLANLCAVEAKKSSKVNEADAQAEEATEEFATFPPKVRDIPCKPLLFDLAFQGLQQPDLEKLLPKRTSAAAGQKKGGLFGKIAGGVTSGLGGLWGRKK